MGLTIDLTGCLVGLASRVVRFEQPDRPGEPDAARRDTRCVGRCAHRPDPAKDENGPISAGDGDGLLEHVKRPVNIGDDSLPSYRDLIGADGPQTRKPNKTGVPYRFLRRAH